VETTVAAPVEWVEAVSGLRLPPKVDARLQHLIDRNTEGLLTDSVSALSAARTLVASGAPTAVLSSCWTWNKSGE